MSEECSFPEYGIELIESSAWVSAGKYEHKDYILKIEDKYYKVTESRAGSYFTDYVYMSQWWDDVVEPIEVEKVEVTTYEWKPIKGSVPQAF